MIEQAELRRNGTSVRRWQYVAALLAVGLALSGWLASRQLRRNEQLAEARLELLSRRLLDRLVERMERYESGLRGVRGVLVATGPQNMTASAFRRYYNALDSAREYPGAHGIGFIRRVTRGQEAELVREMQQDDPGGFAIRELAPSSGERYVIQYVEPLAGNAAARGLDIAGNAERRAAADGATVSDLATMTAPINLVQPAGLTARGVLLLLPVFREGSPHDTPAQRTAASVGWAYAPLVIAEVLHGFADDASLALELYDVGPYGARSPLFSSGQASEVAALPARVILRRALLGRVWELELRARPALLAELNLLPPGSVFAAAALTTLLLAGLVQLYWLHRARALQVLAQRSEWSASLALQVAERTEQLRAAHRNLQTILDALPSRIAYFDRSLHNRFANRAYASNFASAHAPLPGKHLRELLGDEQLAQLAPRLEAALRGEPQTFERTSPAAQGGVTYHGLVHYLPDVVAGEVRGFYVLEHDVSELSASRLRLASALQKAEDATRELARERERLDAILRGTGVGTWEWHVPSGEVQLNERWAAMLGHTLAELSPTRIETWLSRLHPEDLQRAAETVTRHVRGDPAPFEFEARMRHAAGHWVWTVTRGRVTTRDAQGRPERMHGTQQDDSARHATEAALREAMLAAEAASAAKSAFLANMSHEIRTPLNAILGLAHLLSGTALDPEQRDCLSKLELAGRALLGGLNDVLDLSKIEAAEMELESARFDLHELVSELEQLVGPQARAKQLELRVLRSSQLPRHVYGDVTRVRQVLLNLLSNAVKFTERGHVELELSCDQPAQDGAETVLLRCWVRDTGIGISSEARANIFSAFTQADASTTRRFGGSGLGLSIARHLSELMGGEIGVRSAPGQGSEFWVRLPLQLAAADELALPPVRQALIADDDPVNRIGLSAMVRALGFEVEAVASGTALCERALCRLRAGQPLDAILTDLHMPDLSGLTALAAIAEQLRGSVQLPAAFLVSASSASELADTPQLSLVRGVLEKPVSLDALARALNDALGAPSRSGSPGRWSADTLSMDVERLPDVQVLVVDDSAINLEVARRILERDGALVTTAADGGEALQRLSAEPERFDVVLMDLQMPVMDGHEATRRIRQQLQLTTLPVIALTAGALVSERQRALEAGMSAFATKPLDPRSLGRLLRQHVERARGAPLPLRQRGASRAVRAASAIPGLDATHLPPELARDPARLALLLETLLREAEDAPRDTTGLPQLHKLRGSAAALGAKELAHCAGALERALREADDAGSARERARLERALSALREQTLAALQQSAAQRTAAS